MALDVYTESGWSDGGVIMHGRHSIHQAVVAHSGSEAELFSVVMVSVGCLGLKSL